MEQWGQGGLLNKALDIEPELSVPVFSRLQFSLGLPLLSRGGHQGLRNSGISRKFVAEYGIDLLAILKANVGRTIFHYNL